MRCDAMPSLFLVGGCRSVASNTGMLFWFLRYFGRNPAVLEPVGWHPVIFMDLLAPCPVLTVHAVPRVVVRRVLQTLLAEINDITVLLGVVFQHDPRHRVMAVADAVTATDRHVGVSHFPGQLVDQHILD